MYGLIIVGNGAFGGVLFHAGARTAQLRYTDLREVKMKFFTWDDDGAVLGPIDSSEPPPLRWHLREIVAVIATPAASAAAPDLESICSRLRTATDLQRSLRARQAHVCSSDRDAVELVRRIMTTVPPRRAEADLTEQERLMVVEYSIERPRMERLLALLSGGLTPTGAQKAAGVPSAKVRQWHALAESGVAQFEWFITAFAQAHEASRAVRATSGPAEAAFTVRFGEGTVEVARPTTRPGWVYFFAPLGGGPIKIGFTDRRIRDRLRQVQNFSPVWLSVRGFFFADEQSEQELHAIFDAERSHGEWFRLTRRLELFIEHMNRVGRVDRPCEEAFRAELSNAARFGERHGIPSR